MHQLQHQVITPSLVSVYTLLQSQSFVRSMMPHNAAMVVCRLAYLSSMGLPSGMTQVQALHKSTEPQD